MMSNKKKEIKPEDIDIDPLKKSQTDKVVPIKLTEKSRFKFRCHKGVKCFTACCSNINIVLPPYDLLRLRKRLGMTTEDFINKYCEIEMLAKTLLPVITLKMQSDEKRSCPFVTPDGCTVYEDRPSNCRYYPLGMATLRKRTPKAGKTSSISWSRKTTARGSMRTKSGPLQSGAKTRKRMSTTTATADGWIS